MSNILLINVHNVQQNPEKKFLQGPLYLGASLKSYGYNIKYLDLQLYKSNLNIINKPDETYDTDFIQGVIPNYVSKSKHSDSLSANSSKIPNPIPEIATAGRFPKPATITIMKDLTV